MKVEEAVRRLRDVARRKHLSLATEDAYAGWLARYAAFLDRLDGAASLAAEQKMEAFLTAEARRGVAASTQNQAFNALLFFYRDVMGRELSGIDALRAKTPARIRTAPELDDVRALLGAVRDLHGYPTRLIVRLIYGCGLRVTEPLNLRIKDVKLAESRLVLRGAKGGKDRIVAIPCSLARELREQVDAARVIWRRDVSARIPVALPGLLAAKYPQHAHAWSWSWLFPAHHPCAHPRTGATVRWRCHEANVQRAVKLAARGLGLVITPHQLRHAYATHALRAGANVRDLQAAMGHASLETTAGYLHPECGRLASPLEMVEA